jgi:HD-GYP domain-containing protein (c-di-GMP phosphodiesterase class II)
MNSERCYKKKYSKEQIINELKDNSGTQFDPKIVDIFLQMLEDGSITFD